MGRVGHYSTYYPSGVNNCNSFDDRACVDVIYRYPIVRWIAETAWHGTRILVPVMAARLHAPSSPGGQSNVSPYRSIDVVCTRLFFTNHHMMLGRLNLNMLPYHYRDSIIKIRRFHDRLIFITGIRLPKKTVCILRRGPDYRFSSISITMKCPDFYFQIKFCVCVQPMRDDVTV